MRCPRRARARRIADSLSLRICLSWFDSNCLRLRRTRRWPDMLTPLRNRRRAFSILRAAGVGVSGGRSGGRWRRRKLRRGPRGAGARATRPPQARGGVERARRGVRFALLQLNLHPDHVAHRDARRTASGGGGDRPSTERRAQHKGVRRAGEQREEKGEQPHGAATTEEAARCRPGRRARAELAVARSCEELASAKSDARPGSSAAAATAEL